jgi:hypothetical protein
MIISENYWQNQIHRIMPDLEIEDIELFQEGLVASPKRTMARN